MRDLPRVCFVSLRTLAQSVPRAALRFEFAGPLNMHLSDCSYTRDSERNKGVQERAAVAFDHAQAMSGKIGQPGDFGRCGIQRVSSESAACASSHQHLSVG